MGGFSGHKTGHLIAFVIASVILLLPSAQAGEMVLATCWDKTGSGMGKRVYKLLTKELISKGAKLKSYRLYLKFAQTKGLDRKALTPSSIRILAGSLTLDGVATCRVTKSGSRLSVELKLYGQSGKQLFAGSYANKKPWLRLGTVQALADKLMVSTGAKPDTLTKDEDELALVPLVPLVAVEVKKPEHKDESLPGGKTKLDISSPKSGIGKITKIEKSADKPVKRKDTQKPKMEALAEHKVETKPVPKPVVIVSTPAKDITVGVESRAHKRLAREKLPAGPNPSLLVELGASYYSRAGLSPRYEAGFYPGIRLDAHVFLGTFLDTPVLKDLGFGGSYDRAFGLRYSSDNRPEKLAGKEQHWSAQLMYRLEIEKLLHHEVLTAPTLVMRFGYGDSKNSIDKKFPDVLSAHYTYTYGALDLDLWLLRPMLSLSVSAGYLFDVWPSDSLAGNGTGFCISAGLSLSVLRVLRIWAGYEQIQFLLDERRLGSTSDRYQMFSMRFGWFFN